MKPTLLLATLTLASVALLSGGQATLTGTCQSGGNPSYPQCVSGEVTFTGTNYNPEVHVKVTNSNGDVIDNSTYSATVTGNLTFTENFSFADTYTVQIDDNSSTVTVTIVTN
jgi:hypothetical protein